MKHYLKPILVILTVLLIAGATIVPALAQQPAVTMVMFFSPTCPHCHKVIQETLIPMLRNSSQEINILMVNTSTGGGNLYEQTVKELGLNENGIPALVIGDTFLLGDGDIPAKLPKLVEQAATDAKYASPQVNALKDIATLAKQSYAYMLTKANIDQVNTDGTLKGKEGNQSAGSQMGIEGLLLGLTLAALFATLVIQVYGMLIGAAHTTRRPLDRRVYYALIAVGLLIAGYLTVIYVTEQSTYCFGSTGCDAVKSSTYAYLFGVIPMPALGVLSYLVLLALVLYRQRFRNLEWKYDRHIPIFFIGLLAFNNLFMIALNYIELAEIRAVCLWCWVFTLTNLALSWLAILFGGLRDSLSTRQLKHRKSHK